MNNLVVFVEFSREGFAGGWQ